MVLFKNKVMYKTTTTSTKNSIGQVTKSYEKQSLGYDIDMQPIDEKAIKYTFGEDIKSNYMIFSDEDLVIDDVIMIGDKAYSIEKKIDWIDYKIYAIMDCDVMVS